MKPRVTYMFALKPSQVQKTTLYQGYPNQFQNNREKDVQTDRQKDRQIDIFVFIYVEVY